MAKNLWHECEPHKKGNPTIFDIKYRKVTVVNKDKRIRKCEIGNSDGRYVADKVIMFVGEKGTGKTTTINTIVNHLLGVQWDDNERYRLIADDEERAATSQTVSQTKWISSYIFHQTKSVNCRVTLVDTPGYWHTGGKASDDFVTSQVQEFFGTKGEGGLDHIDAVAFVVKASSVRLNETQKYIFNSVFHLFGKDIGDNIFVFITHAETEHMNIGKAPVMEAIVLADVNPKGYCICNNNVLFYQTNKQNKSTPTILDSVNKLVWNAIQTNLRSFFTELDMCLPKSILLSATVLSERRNLEIAVKGLPDLISRRLVELNKLSTEAKIFEKYANEINSNEDFSYEVVENKIEEILLEGSEHATICTACKVTCHYPCKRDMFMEVGGVRMCAAMRFPTGGSCRVCNCMPGNHETVSKKYEVNIVTTTKTNPLKEVKHTTAKQKLDNREKVLCDIIDEQKRIHRSIENSVEELRTCLKRLSEIALKPNPVLLVQELTYLQQKESLEGKPQWEERVNELRRICKREAERVGEAPSELKRDQMEQRQDSKNVDNK